MLEKQSVLESSQPKELKTRSGYHNITTVDPRDGSSWELAVPPALLKKCSKRGLAATKDLAFAVKEGLEKRKIAGIFHGVRDTDNGSRGDDDYLCYVILAERRYRDDGTDYAPIGKVLLVFVDEERVIYNFYWSDTEPGSEKLPEDHNERFLRKLI